MKLLIAAIGRLRAGPEIELTRAYLARAEAGGRSLALAPAELVELEAKPAGDKKREAEALLRAAPPGAKTILLDERGEDLPSRRLAETLARWRDQGAPAATFWIGGADGTDPGLRDHADLTLAFGRQTWPHRLVRVMLAEQIYRAVTILSANPYHRD